MLPPGLCFGEFFSQANFSSHLLQRQQMGSYLHGEPKAVERFMRSTRRTGKYLEPCRWRTMTTAHRRLLEEMFTFRMPARSLMTLTPCPVTNGGITQAVAKGVVARRPSCTTG